LELLRTALATVTEILAQHERAANEGLFAEVDETRPSLARQEDQLRREHRDLSERARALDEDIRQALEMSPATASMSIPSDMGVRAKQLALDLEEHGKAETCLVLDSINTDIGAGD
jgi:hypothetical protein